jgi:uncharacterized Zn-finger protein
MAFLRKLRLLNFIVVKKKMNSKSNFLNQIVELYQCNYDKCNKSFCIKGNLTTHMLIHLGIKSFKCNYPNCNKTFVTKGNLKTHTFHHTATKPFSCNFENCKRSYSNKCRLKIHLRTHVNIYFLILKVEI